MDLAATARTILASSIYMTLATADEDGRPWATPVYAAVEDLAEMLWVSRPETRHSQNIAVRPQASAAGGRSWEPAAVRTPAPLRLYRLVAEERWVRGDGDRRIALPEHARRQRRY